MGTFNDLTGKRFGMLTVLYRTFDRPNKTRWRCKCDCGKETTVNYGNLLSGATKSCGCNKSKTFNRVDIREKNRIATSTVNGKSSSRLYHIYIGMIGRCYGSGQSYHDYGERGIYIVNEWYMPGIKGNPGFINFYNWAMSNGYHDPMPNEPRSKWLSIDRIDNNGPYAPWNCRWTTGKIQSNNTRWNVQITDLDGITYTLTEFCRMHNVNYDHIRSHFRRNWPLAAIMYDVYFPDVELHRFNNQFYNKDGFIVLVPSIDKLRTLVK